MVLNSRNGNRSGLNKRQNGRYKACVHVIQNVDLFKLETKVDIGLICTRLKKGIHKMFCTRIIKLEKGPLEIESTR